jgi:hypothetical protein
MTREEVLREKMQQLLDLLEELSSMCCGSFDVHGMFGTAPTPAYWEKGLNALFDALNIPAKVVGWWDGTDGEHVPCSPEGCGDDEPCREFEELANSPDVVRYDIYGNTLLVKLYY